MLRDTKYLSVRTSGDDEVMCRHVSGENVLVHCLAGAHRAGTAGVIAVMYLTGLRHVQVTPTPRHELDTDISLHCLHFRHWRPPGEQDLLLNPLEALNPF